MANENTPLAANPPKLLDQVRDKIRVKHYSIRTETQYGVKWGGVKWGRSPIETTQQHQSNRN